MAEGSPLVKDSRRGRMPSHQKPSGFARLSILLFPFFLTVLLLTHSQNIAAQVRERPPNILILLADDVGWNDVGYHGSEIKTPNVDRLAREGVELHHFYAYATCSPSRAALLTGRNPDRFGLLGPIGKTTHIALPRNVNTLADVLRQSGYVTALIGKWHLGRRPQNRPRQYGFDYSYGQLDGEVDKYEHRYQDGSPSWHRNDHLVEEKGHTDDLITAEAIRFLSKTRDKRKPFFLYVPFGLAHFPHQEEDRWTNPYKITIGNNSRRVFAAATTHMDYNVGRLLTALADERLVENTIVIFFSDNGGGKEKRFNSSDYNGKFPDYDRYGSNEPLRGYKDELYEGGIRVPAIVRWPGKLKPAKVMQVISVNDLYPTLARSAKAQVVEAPTLDGMNVWPFISGELTRAERILYWRTQEQAAVRKGDWKLIRRGKNFADGSLSEADGDELFNLALDPYETNNLATTNSAKLIDMRDELDRCLRRAQLSDGRQ
jgi:arylsulfatase B